MFPVMLWLALNFPLLPLEAHSARPLSSAAVAHGHVIACDEVAAAGGICAGMRLSTARGMLPELTLVQRDEAREVRMLGELACWAGNLSPEVSPCPPAALLVEIGGCLRLFGGPGPILDAARAGCAERGITVELAAAVTPLAALWLARAGAEVVCPTREALPELLAELPLEVLLDGAGEGGQGGGSSGRGGKGDGATTGCSAETLQRLQTCGLRRLGDLFRLPRSGLAERFGAGFAATLARGLGETPDLRARFAFPERFAQQVELPAPAREAAMLAFPARRLIADFCGWLAARQRGADSCLLVLEHERRRDGPRESRLDLRLAELSRDPERFGRVLRERLERFALAAPVVVLRLEADAGSPLAGSSAALFDRRRGGESVERLVERLRARLGEAAVHGVATVAEHRPECASRPVPVGFARPGEARRSRAGSASPGAAASGLAGGGPSGNLPAADAGPRPLWLLAAPESLSEIAGRPHRRGQPLELLAGPERLETGWWDAAEPGAVGDVRRDYFVARSPAAEWLWIYRDGAGWHVQGVFA